MEEVIKQILPGLGKTAPYFVSSGIIIYLLSKMLIGYLKERDDKRSKDRKEASEKLARQVQEAEDKRESFFLDELDKRDHVIQKREAIIHEKDEEIKKLNTQLMAILQENINVQRNMSVIIDNLKGLLNAALKLNEKSN